MNILEWFYLIGVIGMIVGGIFHIAEWHRDRDTDDRPFSWKRWLTKADDLTPTETLANGIILIVSAMVVGLSFVFYLDC